MDARSADALVVAKRAVLAAFKHPDIPLLDLLSEVRAPRPAPGTNPLFTTCFSYLPESYDSKSLPMDEAAFDFWRTSRVNPDASPRLTGFEFTSSPCIMPVK